MEKNIKYPIEAFALAMVLFSSGMKEAALVGISLIFGDILLCLAKERSTESNANTLAFVSTVVTVIVSALMFVLSGTKIETKMVVYLVILALLLLKHDKDNAEVTDFDYDEILFVDTKAYAAFILVSILREYCSAGKIFGIALPKLPVVNPGIGQAMFAILATGFIVCLLNKVSNNESKKDAGLWVCLPLVLFEAPLVFSKAIETDGVFLGIVFTTLLYFTFRKKVESLNVPSFMKGLPCEMIMLSVVYMVLSIL